MTSEGGIREERVGPQYAHHSPSNGGKTQGRIKSKPAVGVQPKKNYEEASISTHMLIEGSAMEDEMKHIKSKMMSLVQKI